MKVHDMAEMPEQQKADLIWISEMGCARGSNSSSVYQNAQVNSGSRVFVMIII